MTERRAPVNVRSGPYAGATIPWAVHVVAWERYAIVFPGSARDQDAERIAERGGFSPTELDTLVPDWRSSVERPT